MTSATLTSTRPYAIIGASWVDVALGNNKGVRTGIHAFKPGRMTANMPHSGRTAVDVRPESFPKSRVRDSNPLCWSESPEAYP